MTFPDSFTIISDEVSQEPAELARFLRDYRLPGFELRSMFGRAFRDLTLADIAMIRDFAADGGWNIAGCATPVFKCDLADNNAVKEHIELFKRSLDVALALKCDLLRVFTFLRKPHVSGATSLEQVATHLQTLLTLARGSGVRVGIENEHSCLVATAEELAGVFDHLDDPQAGIIWDPCNFLYVPEYNGPATAGYTALASRIIHIHVKDSRRQTPASDRLSAVATPVGEGEVGWGEHLRQIAQSGYQGLLALETHWRRQNLAEEMLHLPAGHAFSAGGDEASRLCMDALRKLALAPA